MTSLRSMNPPQTPSGSKRYPATSRRNIPLSKPTMPCSRSESRTSATLCCMSDHMGPRPIACDAGSRCGTLRGSDDADNPTRALSSHERSTHPIANALSWNNSVGCSVINPSSITDDRTKHDRRGGDRCAHSGESEGARRARENCGTWVHRMRPVMPTNARRLAAACIVQRNAIAQGPAAFDANVTPLAVATVSRIQPTAHHCGFPPRSTLLPSGCHRPRNPINRADHCT